MRMFRTLLVALCLLWLSPQAAWSHAVSNSYLELTATPERISGQWRVALRDLDGALGLDADANGRILDREISERAEAIRSYLSARLELTAAERLCALAASAPSVTGAYLVLGISSDCRGAPRALRYDLFLDHDRAHEGHLSVTGSSELHHVFTSQARRVTLPAGAPAWHGALLSYLAQGIRHILIGADHILFLLTLLVASVLRYESGRYEPIASFRSAFAGVVRVVTAFTAAHSLTLSLMALGLVSPPSRWVEVAIALSVVAAAANNLWPVVPRRIWVLAFAFGLIHGLGFAGVLLELGLPPSRLIVGLLGFNLGVEVGQLGIVAVILPLGFWLRRRQGFLRLGLWGGSALAGAVGLFWSLERALGTEWVRVEDGAEAKTRPVPAGAEPRACRGLPALADRALYAATLTPNDGGAATRAHHRALEAACAGELDVAAGLYAQALAVSGEALPAAARAWMLRAYAEVERGLGREAEAEELFAQAIESWRELGAEQPLAETLARLGELMARDGRWADAYLYYDEASRLHAAGGETALLARDLSRLGDALVSAADPGGAKDLYERARAAYEQVADVAGVASQYRNLAIVARLNGDTALAAQMYRRAIELHERHGHPPEAASDMAALARVYLGRQEYVEAQTLYEQANRIEQQLGRTRLLAKNYNQLGNLHLLQGELSLAEPMYREALRLSEHAGDAAEAANHWANLAGVYHQRGELAQAREMYERSLSLFEESGAEAKVRRVRGLLAGLGRSRALGR